MPSCMQWRTHGCSAGSVLDASVTTLAALWAPLGSALRSRCGTWATQLIVDNLSCPDNARRGFVLTHRGNSVMQLA